MKKLDFRSVLAALVAAVINRSVLLMMNPFGIAYFVSAYTRGRGRVLLTFAALGGMATAVPVKVLLKYAGVMAGIIIIEKILKICRKQVVPWLMALISGFLVSAAGTAYTLGLNGFYMESVRQAVIVNVLEGVIVCCLVFIFDRGVQMIYGETEGKIPGNEAQISLGLLIGVSIYAISGYGSDKYSVTEAVLFFMLLFMGYKYGSAASAVTGACVGAVIAFRLDDISMIGLMCILGAMAGVFKERGRVAGIFSLMASVGVMGYLGAGYMLQLTTVRGLLAGTICFLLMPERLFNENGEKKEDTAPRFSQVIMNQQTKKKLREFSESFKKLSKTFNEGVRPRAELSKEEVDEAFDELTQNVCARCSRCEFCWEREYEDTCFAANNILDYFSKNGFIEKNQLPIAFRRRCINIDGFLNETARVIELAKLNLNWKNKLMESRLAVAGQFFEVADIIEDFSDSLDKDDTRVVSDTKKLKQKLAARKIKVKELTVIEKTGGRTCVYLTAKMGHGRFVTTREICDLLKNVLHRDFILGKECRMVVSKEYMTYEFVEDTRFKTLEGVAKVPKADEKISGDAYTLIHLDSGQVVMSLADGMGSGETASAESEYIIHLMEQLIETGFGKQAAIRLINSMMFLKPEKQGFSTVDMGVIDLFTGKCEFIKVGAAASFIKRGEDVECIISSTLPVGAFTQVDYEGITKELSPGDMVIMVTDGIINSLQAEKGEEKLMSYIKSLATENPQETAEAILNYAAAQSGGDIGDDMSVLTCGLYENVS